MEITEEQFKKIKEELPLSKFNEIFPPLSVTDMCDNYGIEPFITHGTTENALIAQSIADPTILWLNPSFDWMFVELENSSSQFIKPTPKV